MLESVCNNLCHSDWVTLCSHSGEPVETTPTRGCELVGGGRDGIDGREVIGAGDGPRGWGLVTVGRLWPSSSFKLSGILPCN